MSLEDLVKKRRLKDEEARRIRRREPGWDLVNQRPPKVMKYALIYLVEAGGRYVASKIAELPLNELDELRGQVNIPKAP